MFTKDNTLYQRTKAQKKKGLYFKIIDEIRGQDLFGQPAEVCSHQEKTMKTRIGGLFSIFIIVGMLSFLYAKIKIVFTRGNSQLA